MSQKIKFLRNKTVFESKEDAILALNTEVTHEVAQPVAAIYGTTLEPKTLFALGIKSGIGEDCFELFATLDELMNMSVVLFTEQTLTDLQKSQARNNIDSISIGDVKIGGRNLFINNVSLALQPIVSGSITQSNMMDEDEIYRRCILTEAATGGYIAQNTYRGITGKHINSVYVRHDASSSVLIKTSTTGQGDTNYTEVPPNTWFRINTKPTDAYKNVDNFVIQFDAGLITTFDIKNNQIEEGNTVSSYAPMPYTADGVDITSTFVDGKNVLRLSGRERLKYLNGDILTASMISQADTVYVLQNDMDLGGATINFLGKSALVVRGGTLSNGQLGGDFDIIAPTTMKIFDNIVLPNIPTVYAHWFGVNEDSEDNSAALQAAISSTGKTYPFFRTIKFTNGLFKFKNTVEVGNAQLEGISPTDKYSSYYTTYKTVLQNNIPEDTENPDTLKPLFLVTGTEETVLDVASTHFKNLIIESSGNIGSYVEHTCGIQTNHASSLVIENCCFQYLGLGIDMKSIINTKIQNTDFFENKLSCFTSHTAENPIKGTTIFFTNCYFSQNDIHFKNTRNTLSDLHFSDCILESARARSLEIEPQGFTLLTLTNCYSENNNNKDPFYKSEILVHPDNNPDISRFCITSVGNIWAGYTSVGDTTFIEMYAGKFTSIGDVFSRYKSVVKVVDTDVIDDEILNIEVKSSLRDTVNHILDPESIITQGKTFVNLECTANTNRVLDNRKSGTIRPVGVRIGYEFFDTALNMPVWWNGVDWTNIYNDVFDYVQIGGKNIYAGSQYVKPTLNAGSSSGTVELITDESELPFYRVTPTEGLKTSVYYGMPTVYKALVGRHTSSIFVKQDSGSPITISVYINGTVAADRNKFTLESGVWTRVYANFEKVDNFIIISDVADVNLDLNRFQLEEGNFMTTYGDKLPIYETSDLEIVTTGIENYLRFADRPRYKILRGESVDGVNTLKSAMLLEPDTIYVIQEDMDMGNATIPVPANSTLKFLGGKLSNGVLRCATINNFSIDAPSTQQIFSNVIVEDIAEVYIDWFGGSTTLDDNSDALKAALISQSGDQSYKYWGRKVKFNFGEYKFTKTVDINGSSLEGVIPAQKLNSWENQHKTVIRFTPEEGILFNLHLVDGQDAYQVGATYISNIHFRTNYTRTIATPTEEPKPNITCIDTTGASSLYMRNCDIRHFNVALSLKAMIYSEFDNVSITENVLGIYFNHLEVNPAVSTSTLFKSCYISQNITHFQNYRGSLYNCTFYNCIFESSRHYSMIISTHGLNKMIIDSCYAENNVYNSDRTIYPYEIYVEPSTASTNSDIVITNCNFAGVMEGYERTDFIYIPQGDFTFLNNNFKKYKYVAKLDGSGLTDVTNIGVSFKSKLRDSLGFRDESIILVNPEKITIELFETIDVLRFSEQTLTDVQKNQVLSNLGILIGEGTQAEYDALTTEEKESYTLYKIIE